ncbi:hypothetical protein [Actinacidiphila acidipaludis]|nr:hypothetical protein [Streptomyces acidipaludis]
MTTSPFAAGFAEGLAPSSRSATACEASASNRINCPPLPPK